MTTFKKAEKIQKLSSKKKRTASSREWLIRQLNDPYVALAKKEGYRSRAAFKLVEIQQKFKIIKKGARVLDLGAAPGGWCQVAKGLVGPTGIVVGVDLTEIVPITEVVLLQGDFLDEAIQNRLITELAGQKANVIMSDMAAKACGMPDVDHIRLMDLLESALVFAEEHLAHGGSFVAKVLRGGTERTLLTTLKRLFTKVSHFKPDSSRQESSELYVIATGFRTPPKTIKKNHTPEDNLA